MNPRPEEIFSHHIVDDLKSIESGISDVALSKLCDLMRESEDWPIALRNGFALMYRMGWRCALNEAAEMQDVPSYDGRDLPPTPGTCYPLRVKMDPRRDSRN